MSHKIVKSWKTKAGLDACVLLVNDGSHHCGYVEVPEAIGHLDFYTWRESTVDISVHGGVTYQGTPEWANGKQVIGFDCAHAGDKTKYSYLEDNDVWRDEEYCVNECESMAEQLINLVPKIN
jgi:hypothetical protein|nr:MAG TPA: hypothetical protein [Caudoviricetes sp.]